MLPCAAGASISYSAYLHVHWINPPTHYLTNIQVQTTHVHTHTHYCEANVYGVSLIFVGLFYQKLNLHVVRFYMSVNIYVLQFEHERVYVTIALYSRLLSNTFSLIILQNMFIYNCVIHSGLLSFSFLSSMQSIYVCLNTLVYVYARTWVGRLVVVHIYTYIYIYAYTNTCTYVFMYV